MLLSMCQNADEKLHNDQKKHHSGPRGLPEVKKRAASYSALTLCTTRQELIT